MSQKQYEEHGNQNERIYNEWSNTQESADEDRNKEQSSELITRIPLGGSKLLKVGTENGWAVVLGPHRITQWYENEGLLMNYIEHEGKWDFMLRLISCIMEINERAIEKRKGRDMPDSMLAKEKNLEK